MKPIELLAPAGNADCALAAFEAGADAVYAGLSKFSARERAENFTPDTMGRTIEYAHKLGRKVYVTFNTILKEEELSEAMESLALLSDLTPDALIVQDLGVIRLIREYFPDLAFHASTQMGFHNSPGVAFAAQLGAKRVILERQMTLEELQAVREKSQVELEVFIHGALCCSLSGQCLFSSYLGGCSGNRGRCKQPCRRRFFGRDGNGFFFSPQDLCTIDMIPELKKIGVDSLKIEGRLKQNDYVRNTVSAYRMVLDAPEDADIRAVLGEARSLLAKTCGRKWSVGFFRESALEFLIDYRSLGAAGLLCGKVGRTDGKGFLFITGKPLHLGDRVRVQALSGEDGPALTLTKMFVNDRSVKKVKAGEQVYICCDKEVAEGGAVYKIGETVRDYANALAALPAPKDKLNLAIAVSSSKITVKVENASIPDWEEAVAFAEAQKHAAEPATIEKEFRAADSETFAAGKIQVHCAGSLFIPAPVLKQLRRNFYEHVKAHYRAGSLFRHSAEGLARFVSDYAALKPAELPERVQETVAVKPDGALPGNPKARRAVSVFEFNRTTDEVILPEFTPEARLETLKKAIRRAYDAGIRRFRTTSLFELALLKEYRDITIVAGYPLIVSNSQCVLELQAQGVSQVQAHVELEREAMENLRDHSALPVEIYRFGRPPLLVTRAEVAASGEFRDNRDNAFEVRAESRSGLTRIFPKSILSLPRLAGTLDFYDLRNAAWQDSSPRTEFNFKTGLQ